MGPKKAKKRLYVVQRLGWRVWEDGGRGQCSHDEGDEGVPVRAFASREQAEAFRDELEAEARRELNPFQFEQGEIEFLCSSKEAKFLKAVARLGLEAPTGEPYFEYVDYAKWWDAVRETLTDEQREGVWALLDKLKLYEVAETTLEE